MKLTKPLDELEIFELMQALYPEKYSDEEDDTFDSAVSDFYEIEDLSQFIADLCVCFGRPMQSAITETTYNVFSVSEGEQRFRAIVKREVLSDEP